MAGESTIDIFQAFILRTIDGLLKDAAGKGQKIPITKIFGEADDKGAVIYAPIYFKYLVTGRGPGKFPPPIKMTEWVEANPDVLERARQVYKYITAKQLGYLIGRKIAREGTDIFTGKKPGIDLLGVLDENVKLLMEQIAKNEVINIATQLRQAIK